MVEFSKEPAEVNEWLNRDQNKHFCLVRPKEKIEAMLKQEIDLDNVNKFGSALRRLATWNKNVFLDNLIHDAPAGRSGAEMLDYFFAHLKIIISSIEHPEGRGRVFEKDLHLTFLLLLSFNRWEQAEWLGRRVYEGDSVERFNGPQETYELREVSEWEALGGDTKGLGAVVASLRRLIPGQREKEGSAGQLDDEPAFPYWEDKPLCGLVLRLWLLMSGKVEHPKLLPDGLPQCGVYEGLFKNWDDEEKLSASILEACDYHLSRTEENPATDYDIPEFEMRPYNVLPVEILALRVLRRNLGISTPWPDHPLLSSVFVKNLPEELPPSDHELIQRVYQAAQSVFPKIRMVK